MVRQTILVEFISPGAHDADIVEHGSITGQADSKFNLRPVIHRQGERYHNMRIRRAAYPSRS